MATDEAETSASVLRPGPPTDWTSASVAELIGQITAVHHARTRQLLLQAAALVRQLTIFPIASQGCELSQYFLHFEGDMLSHLDHEESALFPACLALDRASHPGAARDDSIDVSHAIREMSIGHGAARQSIVHLLDLALNLPEGNDPLTVGALHQILVDLDADLVEHGRLEEEILLPAVMFQQELSQTRRTPGIPVSPSSDGSSLGVHHHV